MRRPTIEDIHAAMHQHPRTKWLSGLKDKVAAEFAKANGWTQSHTGFGMCRLSSFAVMEGCTGKYDCDCVQRRATRIFDHALFFKKRDKPVAIVGQPYNVHADDVRRIENVWCLKVSTPRAPWASFWYPGMCRLYVITTRDVDVEFLREQCSPDSMFTQHRSELPSFKDFIANVPGEIADELRSLYVSEEHRPSTDFESEGHLATALIDSRGGCMDEDDCEDAEKLWRQFEKTRQEHVRLANQFDSELGNCNGW